LVLWGVLNIPPSQQQTFLETLERCYSRKANTTAQTPNRSILSYGTTPYPSCDITFAQNDTLRKAPADLAFVLPLPRNTPLLSKGDQWSLENRAIQNLPWWEQELAELHEKKAQLHEKEAQLRDQIIVANNYIATQARHGHDIEGAAMDGFRAEGNDLQASQNHFVSKSSGLTQAQGGYLGRITTPSHSSLEEAVAASDFDMDMTDASLGLNVPRESMQSNIPLVPVAGPSREHSLQPSPQLDGGTRRRKRCRLSEKHLPVIHQNTPSTTSTHDQSTSHRLPDSAAALKQEREQLPEGHRRNRPSRILFGQPSALQVKSPVADPCGAASLVPSESVRSPRSQRPVSYPQSQRWRKSLGVSVKVLREGFERLKII